jgi:hypothetical protein
MDHLSQQKQRAAATCMVACVLASRARFVGHLSEPHFVGGCVMRIATTFGPEQFLSHSFWRHRARRARRVPPCVVYQVFAQATLAILHDGHDHFPGRQYEISVLDANET